jgi:hypothetical protein
MEQENVQCSLRISSCPFTEMTVNKMGAGCCCKGDALLNYEGCKYFFAFGISLCGQ